MTREESIRKTDDIIRELRALIEDLDGLKKHFVDFYDEVIEGDTDHLLGVIEHGRRLELLFCQKFPAFTKSIRKDGKYINTKRTKLIDDMLSKK